VIVDDVAYFAEPFFQDGPVAVAVDEVTAAGASYFSAAGNDNLFDGEGNSISSWEAPEYRDAGSCPAALEAEHCMDFHPGEGVDETLGVTVSAGSTLTVDFQWAEPWQGVETDLDLFLLDAEGNVLDSENGTADNVGSSQKPFEFLQWTNGGESPVQVQLAVNHCFGAGCNAAASAAGPPRLKLGFMQNGGGVTEVEHPRSEGGDVVGPSIFGHAAAAGAISTGAIRFNTTAAPEYFSSRGPVTHLFGPVDGATPAEPLAEAETISKPDLTATDGGINTFFGAPVSGGYRFYGTSAAAPHAAAVAALVRDGAPEASAAQVREALTATALQVGPAGAYGAFDVGAGMIDAEAAVGALYTEPPPGEEEGEGGEEEGETSEEGEGGGEEEAPVEEAPVEEAPVQEEAPPATPAPAPAPLPTESVAPRVAPAATADTTRPRTGIAAHPRKLVRKRRLPVRLRFRFRSDEAGVTYLCKVDRRRFRRCGRKLRRRFGAGRHVLRVRARDRAGNVDRTPAVFRFRVKRVR